MGLVTKPGGRKSTDTAVNSIVRSHPEYHTRVNHYAIKLVDANGFTRPSKSPARAPRQAEKGLILQEDLLLADASMIFHLQQCGYTICIWGIYLATDNQADRTLERWPKRRFVA